MAVIGAAGGVGTFAVQIAEVHAERGVPLVDAGGEVDEPDDPGS